MKRSKLIVAAALLIMFMLACSTLGVGGDDNNNESADLEQIQDNNNDQGNEESQAPENSNQAAAEEEDINSFDTIILDASLENTEFGRLLASGDLFIGDNKANADQETVGQILTLHFVNQSKGDIQVALPCGLVFVPDDENQQPLMLVQPLEVNLAAGEEADLQPYVVCADLGTAAPDVGSGYSIGYLEDGKLLQFAQCVCGEEISSDLGSLDSVGIQFATWSISVDGDMLSLFEGVEDDSVLNEMTGGMLPEEFVEYFSGILEVFGSEEWLTKCGINLED